MLAASVEAHAHHPRARAFVDEVQRPSTLVFCRLTEVACLRLLTQRIAEGFDPLSNSDSIAVYATWRQDERVRLAEEPPGFVELWPALARRDTASAKLWADAYLAAFAIAGAYRLVTFDGGFRQFENRGLDLELLP
ncbi:MAG TPA: TA system VapC family ribonuclease toxin [Thermoanaerobaculia bacterium]|nr:TA system VapC family ribonuclease toxin [Thermoanaerobaculia bacterium]